MVEVSRIWSKTLLRDGEARVKKAAIAGGQAAVCGVVVVVWLVGFLVATAFASFFYFESVTGSKTLAAGGVAIECLVLIALTAFAYAMISRRSE